MITVDPFTVYRPVNNENAKCIFLYVSGSFALLHIIVRVTPPQLSHCSTLSPALQFSLFLFIHIKSTHWTYNSLWNSSETSFICSWHWGRQLGCRGLTRSAELRTTSALIWHFQWSSVTNNPPTNTQANEPPWFLCTMRCMLMCIKILVWIIDFFLGSHQ